MSSEEENLLESKIYEDSPGRHFINVSGIYTERVIISYDLIGKSEDSPYGRRELEIIHVQVDPETYFVVKRVCLHPELPILVVIGVVLVAGEVYGGGQAANHKGLEIIDSGCRKL